MHGKASAFVFTVFLFVVQAEALSATACNLSEIANSKYIIYIKYTNRVSPNKKHFLRLQKLTIRVDAFQGRN